MITDLTNKDQIAQAIEAKAVQIAAELSDAQKRALLHRKAGGNAKGWASLNTIRALHRRKLVLRNKSIVIGGKPYETDTRWPLSSFGFAVIQILQQQQQKAPTIMAQTPSLSRHVATLNLFREQDGTHQITTGHVEMSVLPETPDGLRPIDYIEGLILDAAKLMQQRKVADATAEA